MRLFLHDWVQQLGPPSAAARASDSNAEASEQSCLAVRVTRLTVMMGMPMCRACFLKVDTVYTYTCSQAVQSFTIQQAQLSE